VTSRSFRICITLEASILRITSLKPADTTFPGDHDGHPVVHDSEDKKALLFSEMRFVSIDSMTPRHGLDKRLCHNLKHNLLLPFLRLPPQRVVVPGLTPKSRSLRRTVQPSALVSLKMSFTSGSLPEIVLPVEASNQNRRRSALSPCSPPSSPSAGRNTSTTSRSSTLSSPGVDIDVPFLYLGTRQNQSRLSNTLDRDALKFVRVRSIAFSFAFSSEKEPFSFEARTGFEASTFYRISCERFHHLISTWTTAVADVSGSFVPLEMKT